MTKGAAAPGAWLANWLALTCVWLMARSRGLLVRERNPRARGRLPGAARLRRLLRAVAGGRRVIIQRLVPHAERPHMGPPHVRPVRPGTRNESGDVREGRGSSGGFLGTVCKVSFWGSFGVSGA